MGLNILSIVKGPTFLLSNFLLGAKVLRFLVDR